MANAKRPDAWHAMTTPQLAAVVAAAVSVPGGTPIGASLLGSLDRVELETAARRFERFSKACGCAEGAVLALTSLCVGLAGVVLRAPSGVLATVGLCALVVACSVLAAGIGKIIGIALARARWRLERSRLIRRIGSQEAGDRHVVLR